jgi:zinc transport system permease protein
MISSLGILKLVEKARLYGDAAIGIVSSLGIACGILLASAAGGFNVDLFGYLFGNILAISDTEVVSSIILSLAVIFVIRFFYHELLFITFDEESAKASGVKTKAINTILVLLTSLTVVLAMRVVGIMLISSLLILPPVTALQVARGFKMTILVASIAGVMSVVSGIVISLVADLPAGATIVVFSFLLFVGAFVFGKVFANR